MPTYYQDKPSICEPCQYHTAKSPFRWDCQHPRCWPEDVKFERFWRTIGQSDKQPSWCPLLRGVDKDKTKE